MTHRDNYNPFMKGTPIYDVMIGLHVAQYKQPVSSIV